MSWSTLSEDVWRHILAHVPLSHRLGSCSRVNTTLHRAAAAATQQVVLNQGGAGVQRLLGLCQWMLHHGQHLTSLRLSGFGAQSGATLTQLPCPNLRELDLRELPLQLSASNTQPGLLRTCTRLTKLISIGCPLTGGHTSLAALSALVELQHLALAMGSNQLTVSGSTDDRFMPSTALQHLTQLTYLCLLFVGQLLTTNALQHASCLVNLQELHMYDSTVHISPSTIPGLSSLTALRKVHLQHVDCDPSILQDCTQLQDLELHSLALISAGGAAALHSLLGCVQQLQSLELIELEYDWPVAAAAYTNLTASNHLTKLELTVDNLPADVWQYVSPSDRQLPALQVLSLEWFDFRTIPSTSSSAGHR